MNGAAAGSWRWLATLPARSALRLTATPRAPFALYALYTGALFLVCLVGTFPHELMLRRALDSTATTPVAIEVRGVHLGWTLAYVVDELRVVPRDGNPAVPLLTATTVRAAPSLLGLLRGHPYPLGIHAELYGGALAATVDLRPATFQIEGGLSELDVERYTGLVRFVEGRVRGKVGGTIELGGDARKPATTAGSVALDVRDLALEGGKVRGIGIPDLHFAELRLAGRIRNGRLDVEELRARGDEVDAAGAGSVLLQHPLAASFLNLDLTLTAAAQAPQALRTALNLLPGEARPDGSRRVRLTGTLAQPRLQP